MANDIVIPVPAEISQEGSDVVISFRTSSKDLISRYRPDWLLENLSAAFTGKILAALAGFPVTADYFLVPILKNPHS